MFSESILLAFIEYQILVAFFGSVFAGDNVIIFLSILAGQGITNIYLIFIFSLLGTIFSDAVWLWLFRDSFLKSVLKHKLISRINQDLNLVLNKVFKNNHFLIMLVSKFLYGTRIITIAYLGKIKMPSKKFILYDLIISSIWLFVLVPLGWLAGRGLSRYVDVFQEFQRSIAITLGFVLATYLLRIFISKFITYEEWKKGKIKRKK